MGITVHAQKLHCPPFTRQGNSSMHSKCYMSALLLTDVNLNAAKPERLSPVPYTGV